jgi:hypothetical protein
MHINAQNVHTKEMKSYSNTSGYEVMYSTKQRKGDRMKSVIKKSLFLLLLCVDVAAFN